MGNLIGFGDIHLENFFLSSLFKVLSEHSALLMEQLPIDLVAQDFNRAKEVLLRFWKTYPKKYIEILHYAIYKKKMIIFGIGEEGSPWSNKRAEKMGKNARNAIDYLKKNMKIKNIVIFVGAVHLHPRDPFMKQLGLHKFSKIYIPITQNFYLPQHLINYYRNLPMYDAQARVMMAEFYNWYCNKKHVKPYIFLPNKHIKCIK